MAIKVCVGLMCLSIMLGGMFFALFNKESDTPNATKVNFTLLNGKTYKQSDLTNKTIVINYFAEWCAPCLREIPELNAFYAQAPESVLMFAISYDNLSHQKLTEIKTKYNIQFPLIVDIATPFNFAKPSYLPATFVIKPSGELAGQLLGEQTMETLNEAITAL